jgi:hypothetical protein
MTTLIYHFSWTLRFIPASTDTAIGLYPVQIIDAIDISFFIPGLFTDDLHCSSLYSSEC